MTELNLTPKNVGCTEQKPSDSKDFAPNLTPQMAQPHCKSDPMTELNLTPKMLGVQSKTQ